MSAKYAKKWSLYFVLVSLVYPIDNYRFPQEPIPKRYSFTKEEKKPSSNCQIFIFFYESLLFDFFFFMTYMHFLKEILSRHRGLGHMYRAIPLLAR